MSKKFLLILNGNLLLPETCLQKMREIYYQSAIMPSVIILLPLCMGTMVDYSLTIQEQL